MPDKLEFLAAGITDIGAVRSTNQDAIGLFPETQIWVVADGMGGHAHGELASRAIIEAVAAIEPAPLSARTQRFQSAMQTVNNNLKTRARELGGQVMGSTVVGCLVEEHMAAVVWAGDSRAYRLRGGELEQLTEDHSYVAELVRAGLLTEDQAENHPRANVVTRAIGGDSALKLDQRDIALESGDRLLLCSDGVSKELPYKAIAATLCRPTSPVEACEDLRAAIYQQRASDNLSAIVIDVR